MSEVPATDPGWVACPVGSYWERGRSSSGVEVEGDLVVESVHQMPVPVHGHCDRTVPEPGLDCLWMLLIAEGAHPAVIASRLGHTSVKTVLDVYGHLYEGLDHNTADTLNPPWDRSDLDAMWTQRNRDNDQGRGLA